MSFRNSLLKFGQFPPKPVYNIHNLIGLKLLTKLLFGLSHLNEHNTHHIFKVCVNPLCFGSLEVESIPHFILHCRYFTYFEKTFFHEWQSVDKNILNQSDNEIAELLYESKLKLKIRTVTY